MLVTPPPSATSKNLDNYYGLTSSRSTKVIEEKIDKLGEDFIKAQFESIFSEIRKTLDSSGKSFHKLLFKKDTTYASRSYQVLFLTFYEKLIQEQKVISNYENLAIGYIEGSIKKHFKKREETDPVLNNGVMKLESILSRSKTENTNYDYKIGFHRLYKDGAFDEECFIKVMKTLTGIINIGKGSVGYIILGVADSEKDAKSFISFYPGSNFKKYKNYFVCGLDNEAKKYKSLDDYRTRIAQKIEKSDISPQQYKKQILGNMDMFTYHNKSILILKVEALDEPAEYEGEFYQRLDTSTKLVPRDEKKLIWRKFP
jgi:hypothetical protein